MSAADVTKDSKANAPFEDKKDESTASPAETAPAAAGESVPKKEEEKQAPVSDSVFTMFGGGPKKEKKEEEKEEKEEKDQEENKPSANGTNGTNGTNGLSKKNDDEKNDEEDAEAEVQASFKPVVQLTAQKDQKTGDENEDELLKLRVKIYRYFTNLREFKERGVGELKFLKHRETNKVRIVMRREQVKKLCANHYVSPKFNITQNGTSDRAWVYQAIDNCEADEDEESHIKTKTFAVRCQTPEAAQEFREAYENAQKNNNDVAEASKEEDKKESKE